MNIMVGGRTYVLLPENYFIKNIIIHAGGNNKGEYDGGFGCPIGTVEFAMSTGVY